MVSYGNTYFVERIQGSDDTRVKHYKGQITFHPYMFQKGNLFIKLEMHMPFKCLHSSRNLCLKFVSFHFCRREEARVLDKMLYCK